MKTFVGFPALRAKIEERCSILPEQGGHMKVKGKTVTEYVKFQGVGAIFSTSWYRLCVCSIVVRSIVLSNSILSAFILNITKNSKNHMFFMREGGQMRCGSLCSLHWPL